MNIYEVAAEAGVSISTISRVLNSPEKVAPATRKHVQQILQKNNYVPNAIARGLVQSSMKSVGILASDVRNLYFATAAYTLEDEFFNWGYTTLLCSTGDDLEKKEKYIRILSEKKVDGLVLVGSVFSTPTIKKTLLNYLPETPIAILNGWIAHPNIYAVALDHPLGTELILNHLCERGYENIYFVHASRSQNTLRKVESFIVSMKQRDLPLNERSNVYCCEYSYESILSFAQDFLSLTKRHTAIIFHDDLTAAYGCNAFQRLGLFVPRDVAIVGYDNTRISLLSNPQITSLDTKVEVLASMAASTLHSVFLQNSVSQSITIAPELIVREST